MKWIIIIATGMIFSSCNSDDNRNKNRTNSSTNPTAIINIKNKAMKTIIVDVRSKEEWDNDGHADCSVNYPLDQLMSKIDILKEYDSIILICRSGNRAAHAQSMLESLGLKNIENKGAWQNINCH